MLSGRQNSTLRQQYHQEASERPLSTDQGAKGKGRETLEPARRDSFAPPPAPAPNSQPTPFAMQLPPEVQAALIPPNVTGAHSGVGFPSSSTVQGASFAGSIPGLAQIDAASHAAGLTPDQQAISPIDVVGVESCDQATRLSGVSRRESAQATLLPEAGPSGSNAGSGKVNVSGIDSSVKEETGTANRGNNMEGNDSVLVQQQSDGNSSNNILEDTAMEEEDDDVDEKQHTAGGKAERKRFGRRKIQIEYIEDKARRHITFSKRKAGIMKKAYELSTLTGTQILLLVVSETGLVYTFTTNRLEPIVTEPQGKNLIQECLSDTRNSDTNS